MKQLLRLILMVSCISALFAHNDPVLVLSKCKVWLERLGGGCFKYNKDEKSYERKVGAECEEMPRGGALNKLEQLALAKFLGENYHFNMLAAPTKHGYRIWLLKMKRKLGCDD